MTDTPAEGTTVAQVRQSNGRFGPRITEATEATEAVAPAAPPVVEVVETPAAEEVAALVNEGEATEPEQVIATTVPWSQHMIEVEAGATAEQMLAVAGLNWDVEFGPLQREVLVHYHEREELIEPYVDARKRLVEVTDPDTISYLAANEPDNLTVKYEWRTAPDVRDTRRVDTRQVFGQVRGDYTITQNREAFAFADSLVENDEGRWIAAGTQNHGAVIFAVMKILNGTVTVADDDVVDSYLFMRTSHNGSTGVQVMVTPIRLRCDNMMPIVSQHAVSRWSMRHVSTLEDRLDEARETLQLALTYMTDGFEREVAELLEVPVTDDKARWLLDRHMPKHGQRETFIDGIMAAYHDEALNGYAGTGYGLLNGVTDFYQHTINRRTDASRLAHTLDGDDAKLRAKLVKELLHA